MPMFEYRCEACGAQFEEIVTGDRKPECPECGAPEVEKLFSAFAVGSGGRSSSKPSSSAPPVPT